MSINRVLLSGNLTRDPELRATAGGTPSSRSASPSTTAVATRRPASGRITPISSIARCSEPAPRLSPSTCRKATRLPSRASSASPSGRRKDSIVPSSRWSSRISNSWPSVETSRNQKAGGRKIACLLTYATSGTIAVSRFSRWNYPAVYRLAERMAVDFKYSDAYSRANVVAYKAQDGSIYVGVAIYPI